MTDEENPEVEYAEDAQRPLPGGGINRSGSPTDHGPVHRWRDNEHEGPVEG
jgi:hypothetical protein